MDDALAGILIFFVLIAVAAMTYGTYLLIRSLWVSAMTSRTVEQTGVPEEHQYNGRALQDPSAQDFEDDEEIDDQL